MNNDRAPLVLDEGLFLQAIEALHFLENDRERFSLEDALAEFLNANYVGARFKADVGQEFGREEKRAVEDYVMSVFLVSDPNRLELSYIGEIERKFKGPAMTAIRAVAWAFFSAWTHTYGGLRSHLLAPGSSTLVELPRQP